MAEVILEGLSKRFGSVHALRDLSLGVADGELLVLVGPSGCGKTTTLRLIAGLETPDSGTIRIGGRVVDLLPPKDRDVAVVFQRPALYPHLSVRENLAFGLRMRWGTPSAVLRERVAEAADLLGLNGLLSRRPAELSGGQQQRVALGRALVRRPAVFLLDEPFTALDSRLREDLRGELHLLQRRLRATMMVVTHDENEAVALGDRVAVLHDGWLQQTGKPSELLQKPANRLVAAALARPPMNFLDGALTAHDGRMTLVLGGAVQLPVPAAVAATWAAHSDREVTLGVRPRDVVCAVDRESPGLVPMRVILCEPAAFAGADQARLARLEGPPGWRLTTVLGPPGSLAEGETMLVSLPLEKAFLFDRVTGQTLCQPSGACRAPG